MPIVLKWFLDDSAKGRFPPENTKRTHDRLLYGAFYHEATVVVLKLANAAGKTVLLQDSIFCPKAEALNKLVVLEHC